MKTQTNSYHYTLLPKIKIRDFSNLALSSLIICLTACGGGGEAPIPIEAPSPETFKSEGIFDVNYGQFNGTYALLEDGRFYGIHYVNGNLAGHPRGNLPVDNTLENKSPIAWANFIDDAQMHGAQEVNPIFGKTSFSPDNVDVSIRASFGTFSATSNDQKQWFPSSISTLYFDPITMSTLAGDYDGIMRSVGIQEPMQNVSDLTIDSVGNFSTEVNHCTYTGTFSQYVSTGVFDVYATASGNECIMAPSLTGLLMPINYENEIPQFALMLNNDDQEYTAVFVVSKQ